MDIDRFLEKAKIIRPGDFITFEEERVKYEVQARSQRYLVCTKPFRLRNTVIYTIVDLQERIRGTENLVLCSGFETRELCEEAIARLEGRSGLDFVSEVSSRNRAPLRVRLVWWNDHHKFSDN